MENISLKQAISAIYDMELNNYLMTRAVKSLDGALHKNLPHPEDDFDMPEKPTQPKAPVDDTSIAANTIAAAIIGAIGGAVIKFVFGIVNYLIAYNSAPTGGQDAVVDNAPGLIFGGFWTWVLIFAAIGTVIGVFSGISSKNTYKLRYKDYKAQCEAYDLAMKEYEAECKKCSDLKDQSEREWEAKNEARKNALIQQKNQLHSKIAESSALLNNFYNTVGIDEKFRNIIPMAYMNEFIELGISTKLEGADGLYYLVRKELRMDQMQYKLDTIITKLDTLIDQQHSIYGELLNLNMRCDNMISATIRQTDAMLTQNHLISNQNKLLTDIESNTAIAAYNSERIAKEQEYQSYMIRYQNW